MLNKKISPALFGIILICFFLPFVTVSCGSQAVELNGIDFVTGKELGGGNTVDSEFVAVIAFITAIAGIALGFIRNRTGSLLSALMGGLGFILVYSIKFGLDKEIAKESAGSIIQIHANYQIGFFLLLILNLLAVLFNGYVFSQGNIKSALTDAGTRLCPQCGAQNNNTNTFCSTCGTKFISG